MSSPLRCSGPPAPSKPISPRLPGPSRVHRCAEFGGLTSNWLHPRTPAYPDVRSLGFAPTDPTRALALREGPAWTAKACRAGLVGWLPDLAAALQQAVGERVGCFPEAQAHDVQAAKKFTLL